MNKTFTSLVLAAALLLPLLICADEFLSSSNVHAPSSNTAAVVTYAAVATRKHGIRGVIFSYSAAPTGGNLKIEDGAGNIVETWPITAAGPGPVFYPAPRWGTRNTALIVTLAAGGAGVSGTLTVLYYGTQ